MRCLFEVCLRRGWAGLTDKALMLSKCVIRRQWGSQTPLRQFKGIPVEILSKVGKGGGRVVGCWVAAAGDGCCRSGRSVCPSIALALSGMHPMLLTNQLLLIMLTHPPLLDHSTD